MNINPDQMKMAMEMMKNMNPAEMQRMMETVKNNPGLMNQAMNMMGSQMPKDNGVRENPLESKIQIIQKLKEEGNGYFSKEQFQEAGIKYLNAILEIESCWSANTKIHENQNIEKNLRDLDISCRNNYSITKIKLGEYELLQRHAKRVLELDPNNLKANYNLSLSYYMLNNFEDAKIYVNIAKKLFPKNEELISLKKRIKNKLLSQKANDINSIEDDLYNKEDQLVNKNIKSNISLPSQVDLNTNILDKPDNISIHESIKPKISEFDKHISKSINQHEDDFKIQEENINDVCKLQSENQKSDKIFNNQLNKNVNNKSLSEFLNNYWQILVGILIGLIISKLLK